MKIAILGAGLTGLTAAYYLTQRGKEVIIFEKEAIAGGLASGFKEKNWEWPLERFYHHFFTSDQALIKLSQELGLDSRIFFKKPLTANYYRGQIYPMDSPLALLKFPHLNLSEKIRTGLVLAYLKTISKYKSLEQKSAEAWLKKMMGENSFKALWEPLLASKFGTFAPQVSAAWFWARIKKRSQSLGYFEGSFQVLVDRLLEKIKEQGGKVRFNQEVRKIEKNNLQPASPARFDESRRTGRFSIFLAKRDPAPRDNFQFDLVISTLPTPVFLKIAPNLPKEYQEPLSQIPHLWAQTLVLELKKPFLDKAYWLNINDLSFPFLALVEQTNFISKNHYNKHSILYIGNYLPDNHPYLAKSVVEILEIFAPYLKKINPDFNYKLAIINYKLFSAPYAQPVITVGYQPPPFQTPVQNLYLANLDSVYPWDRETNYAIELGEKIANYLNETFT